MTVPGRRIAVALAAAAAIAGGAAYWAIGTPHYSLAMLAWALRRGDADGVERYVDIDRVGEIGLAAFAERLAGAPARNDWERMQNDVQARLIRLNAPALRGQVREQLRQALSERARNPDAAAAPEVSLARVMRSAGRARVELEIGPERNPIALDMEQQSDRSWRIVGADPRQLTALLP